jgi:hypothetical protein
VTTLDDRYAAAEAAAEAKRRAKARRQPLVLIALMNVLVLGIGFTAVVDLRRLETPTGTALRWVQAAVFGDCTDYLTFSAAGGPPDERSRQQLCADLRAVTADARNERLRIGLRVQGARTAGATAEVRLELVRQGHPTALRVHLVRRHKRWVVLRDAVTCGSVGCA